MSEKRPPNPYHRRFDPRRDDDGGENLIATDMAIPTPLTARQLNDLPRCYDADPNEPTEVKRMRVRTRPLVAQHMPAQVRAWLEVLRGPVDGPIELMSAQTTFGRGQDVDVHIKDAKVSRKHFTVLFADGEFRVRDEES